MSMADEAVGHWIRQFDHDFVFAQPSQLITLGLGLGWLVLVVTGAWVSVKTTVLRIH